LPEVVLWNVSNKNILTLNITFMIMLVLQLARRFRKSTTVTRTCSIKIPPQKQLKHHVVFSPYSTTTLSSDTNSSTAAATLATKTLQVYCDGDGKLCALGVDNNYRDLAMPDIEPLPIPLHNQQVFERLNNQKVDATTLKYLSSGGGDEEGKGNNNFHEGDTKEEKGDGDDGDDGDDEETNDPPPVTPVASAGWAHSAVVSSAGELWVWGRTHDMRNILRVNRKSRLQAWLMGTKRSTDTMEPGPVEIPGVGLPMPRSDGFEELDVDTYAMQLYDEDGQMENMSFDDRVVAVACSAALTGCVTERGLAFLFGDNRLGQCGNSVPSEREWNPVRLRGIPKGERVTSIGLGYQHGVVSTASGRVYSWGKGDRGQLGIGGKRTEHTATAVPVFDEAPTRVDSDSVLDGVSGGGSGADTNSSSDGVIDGGSSSKINRGAVIGPDGVLRIDGKVVAGEVDAEEGEEQVEVKLKEKERVIDEEKYSNTSHQIKEIDESYLSIISEEYDNGLIKGERPRAVDVDSGFSHSAALDSTGSLWVWGKFLSTTLSSDGTRYADQFVPRKIRGIDDRIVQFTCGQFHTTALGASGRMWMVGMKSKSEVESGDDVIDRFSPHPVEIPGTKNLSIKTLKGGWSTTTVITKDGKVYDASWRGIRGPRKELLNYVVDDLAPGFRHRVIIGKERMIMAEEEE
jgi:alpha-tubulin suppressor-like RCC1 family protein